MFLSVSGYKGLNGDILSKVAFLKISDKYPVYKMSDVQAEIEEQLAQEKMQ